MPPESVMKVNMKLITRETVADQLSAYLLHKLSLTALAAWGESRIGIADVRAFGLTWEDCEQLLS
jgi:hypothetical protein